MQYKIDKSIDLHICTIYETEEDIDYIDKYRRNKHNIYNEDYYFKRLYPTYFLKDGNFNYIYQKNKFYSNSNTKH
jgi:hypothetical protein